MILLRLLKNNRTGGVIFIILLMLALWLKLMIQPLEPTSWDGMPLYHLIFSPLQQYPIWNAIVSMVIYGLVSFLLARFNTTYSLLPERSFMSASMFLLVSATYLPTLQISPFLVSSLFLLIALQILIRSDENHENPLVVFNASLILGFGSLFYLKLIWFIPFIWIAIALIRPLKWRELLYPIIVYLLIGLFFFTYYWVFRDDASLFNLLLRENLSLKGTFDEPSIAMWILSAFLFLLIIITSIYIIRQFQAKKIIIRKVYQLFLLFFIYSLLFFIFIAKLQMEAMVLMAIPISYLFSNFFHRKKNHWIHELILWIWIILLAYMIISL